MKSSVMGIMEWADRASMHVGFKKRNPKGATRCDHHERKFFLISPLAHNFIPGQSYPESETCEKGGDEFQEKGG